MSGDESKARGVLQINVISGDYLEDPDVIVEQTGDPFVIIKIGSVQLQTDTKDDTINPQWNEVLNFEGYVPKSGRSAECIVKDENVVIPDAMIGSASFPLPSEMNDDWTNHVLKILDAEGKPHGVITLQSRAVDKAEFRRHTIERKIVALEAELHPHQTPQAQTQTHEDTNYCDCCVVL